MQDFLAIQRIVNIWWWSRTLQTQREDDNVLKTQSIRRVLDVFSHLPHLGGTIHVELGRLELEASL